MLITDKSVKFLSIRNMSPFKLLVIAQRDEIATFDVTFVSNMNASTCILQKNIVSNASLKNKYFTPKL